MPTGRSRRARPTAPDTQVRPTDSVAPAGVSSTRSTRAWTSTRTARTSRRHGASGAWPSTGTSLGGRDGPRTRSACYLAAGRPVVVQDTGFAALLPTGEGLLTFQ